MIKFTDDQKKEIKEQAIKQHKSITAILNGLEIPYSNGVYNRVKNIIDENDCGFVYERDGNRFHKKYFFNEEYFDIIDKQDKAYWLGFLYADGYLIGKNAIGCSLNKKDKTHLELFLNEINVNENPLRYEKSTNSYNFRLTSQHMYDKLVEYGFSTEKSYDITDKPFKVIPDALKKYFVLGFFDGDGYVSLSSENCNLVGVVTNNSDLLKAIVDFANKQFDEEFCKIINNDGYYRMRLSKRKAYYFAEWLYDGSTIKLERKYKNYLRFVKPQDYNRNYRNIRLLKSGRYFVHVQLNNKKISLGTFDTVKEAVDSYNKFASENGLKLQKYIGEELFGDNINE